MLQFVLPECGSWLSDLLMLPDLRLCYLASLAAEAAADIQQVWATCVVFNEKNSGHARKQEC